MLYEGIKRLYNCISKDSSGAKRLDSEENFKPLDLAKVPQEDDEEEKRVIYKELGLSKNNSHKVSMNIHLDRASPGLDDIDEGEGSDSNDKKLIEEPVKRVQKPWPKHLKRKDSEAKQAEQDTDEEIIDTTK